jgi:hypothetical protein
LQPQGAFHARTRSFDLEPGAALLVTTTDSTGWSVHTGYTDAALLADCEERGLRSMLDALRDAEQNTQTGERAVKSVADTSAVLWTWV